MLLSYHPLRSWLLLFACFVLLLDVMVLVKMQSPYVLPKILKEDYIYIPDCEAGCHLRSCFNKHVHESLIRAKIFIFLKLSLSNTIPLINSPLYLLQSNIHNL